MEGEDSLAVYTSLEMIIDCRANKPDGWRYLVSRYVPVIRRVVSHYSGDANLSSRVDKLLLQLHSPADPLYSSSSINEREFIAALRQRVLDLMDTERPASAPDVEVDLATLTQALEPLTATERQMLWLESMGYSVESTAGLLNLESSTVEKLRNRAEDLLRAQMDRWKRGLFLQNGRLLGRLEAGTKSGDCLLPSAFVDVIDGRITWGRKKDYETHVVRCWYCVDHFSRIRESDYITKMLKPLTEDEAKPYHQLLGLPEEKKSFFSKLFAS